jgi:hypothetical protein
MTCDDLLIEHSIGKPKAALKLSEAAFDAKLLVLRRGALP